MEKNGFHQAPCSAGPSFGELNGGQLANGVKGIHLPNDTRSPAKMSATRATAPKTQRVHGSKGRLANGQFANGSHPASLAPRLIGPTAKGPPPRFQDPARATQEPAGQPQPPGSSPARQPSGSNVATRPSTIRKPPASVRPSTSAQQARPEPSQPLSVQPTSRPHRTPQSQPQNAQHARPSLPSQSSQPPRGPVCSSRPPLPSISSPTPGSGNTVTTPNPVRPPSPPSSPRVPVLKPIDSYGDLVIDLTGPGGMEPLPFDSKRTDVLPSIFDPSDFYINPPGGTPAMPGPRPPRPAFLGELPLSQTQTHAAAQSRRKHIHLPAVNQPRFCRTLDPPQPTRLITSADPGGQPYTPPVPGTYIRLGCYSSGHLLVPNWRCPDLGCCCRFGCGDTFCVICRFMSTPGPVFVPVENQAPRPRARVEDTRQAAAKRSRDEEGQTTEAFVQSVLNNPTAERKQVPEAKRLRDNERRRQRRAAERERKHAKSAQGREKKVSKEGSPAAGGPSERQPQSRERLQGSSSSPDTASGLSAGCTIEGEDDLDAMVAMLLRDK